MIALFAINYFRTVRRIACFKFVWASASHAFSVPEARGIFNFKSLIMAAIGTKYGKRNIHLAVKLKLSRNNSKCFGAFFVAFSFMLAFNYLLDESIRGL